VAPFQRKHVPAHYRNGQTFGRPSLYLPEYCDLVIAKMGEGLSLTAFAGFIGVSVDTIYGWIKCHADFSEAVSRATPARVLALETKLLRSRKGAETTAAIFALRNAAPNEWRDVKHTEHAHRLTADRLTDDQLHAIAAGRQPHEAGTIDADYSVVK
jgi:hypothetical protein